MNVSERLIAIATEVEQLEQDIADKDARIESLERKVVDVGGDLPVAAPTPLDVFPDHESIVWDTWPDTDDTKVRFNQAWVKHGLIGTQWPPYKNVKVARYGELENVTVRRFTAAMTPDYILICRFRVMDATAHPMAAIVQDGDDGYETDVNDMEFLARNYQGGLNAPLSTWRSDYQWLAKVLAKARPDLA